MNSHLHIVQYVHEDASRQVYCLLNAIGSYMSHNKLAHVTFEYANAVVQIAFIMFLFPFWIFTKLVHYCFHCSHSEGQERKS